MGKRTCLEEGCSLNVYRKRRCSEHFYRERDRLRGPLDEWQAALIERRRVYWGWDDTKLLYIVSVIIGRDIASLDELTAREADKVTSRIPVAPKAGA